jgi:hypothetical protein
MFLALFSEAHLPSMPLPSKTGNFAMFAKVGDRTKKEAPRKNEGLLRNPSRRSP